MQSIAQDLGIKGIKSLGRDELIYRILDGQAMQNSKSGAPAVVKEENRMSRREHRRNRIHSDAPSKVYTATGDKAVKVEKDEPKKQKPEQEAVKTPEKPAVQQAVLEEKPVVPATETVVPQANSDSQKQKKRGRKSKGDKQKQEAVQAAEVQVETVTVEHPEEAAASSEQAPKETVTDNEQAPKKRGRKPRL